MAWKLLVEDGAAVHNGKKIQPKMPCVEEIYVANAVVHEENMAASTTMCRVKKIWMVLPWA